MPDEPNNGYREWIEKAEEDEFAGEKILEGERFPAPACFHFQQMAEKLLKGLLVFRRQPFPKVHDLLELETLLLELEPNIKDVHEELRFLNGYYVETRYPGDYPEFTLDECRKALEASARVKEFVLSKTNHI